MMPYMIVYWGVGGVMVNVVGSGTCNTSSNPERGCLHFDTIGKGMHPTIIFPSMDKW